MKVRARKGLDILHILTQSNWLETNKTELNLIFIFLEYILRNCAIPCILYYKDYKKERKTAADIQHQSCNLTHKDY